MKALADRLFWVREYLEHPENYPTIREHIIGGLREAIAIAEALPELDTVPKFEVAKLSLGPDDSMIVKVGGSVNQAQLAAIRESLQMHFGKLRKMLFLWGEIELLVVTPAEADELRRRAPPERIMELPGE